MKFIILIFAVSFQISSQAQTLDPQTLDDIPSPGSCYFSKCFEIKAAMEKAGKFSYDSQEGLLDLFTARQNIKVRRGQLLPSFNLRISSPIEIFDYIPNLLGFMFPSNWFRLKESKLHERAQYHSYITLMANQKNMAEGLYLATHGELKILQSLESHLKYSAELLKVMNLQYEYGEASFEDVQELNAFVNQLQSEVLLQKNLLQETSLELAYLIDDVQYGDYGPQELALPDLSVIPEIQIKDFEENVFAASPEIKSFKYLEAAARYSKKIRAYDFLTPDSGTENAFGFGYRASLQIGMSQIETIKIRRKAFEGLLRKNLYRIGQQLNTSLKSYQYALAIENSLKYVLGALLDDFRVSAKVDINRFISLLKDNLEAQQMRLHAVHTHLQARAQLERLLLQNENYLLIPESIPSNSSNLECYLRKENNIIQNAINRGELSLPEELHFSSTELGFCF